MEGAKVCIVILDDIVSGGSFLDYSAAIFEFGSYVGVPYFDCFPLRPSEPHQ